MTTLRIALAALLLPGCLSLPGPTPSDLDAGDRPDAPGATVVADGRPDGGGGASVDAAPSPDADPYPWQGTYAITWSRTSGSCASILISVDTLTVDETGAVYHDSHCSIADVTEASTAADSSSLTLTSGAVLRDCAGAHAEEFAQGYVLSFAGAEASATVTADRYTQPGGTYECSIDYQIAGAM